MVLRTIAALILFFQVIGASGASLGASDGTAACAGAFTAQENSADAVRTRLQQGFFRAISELKTMGLNGLAGPIERGEVAIESRPKRWFWQSAVAVKFSLNNTKKIIIRELDFSNEKASQLSLWNVAVGLYQAQVQSRLFSSERTFSRAQAKLDDGSDEDALDYFVIGMPLEWRSERLRLVSSLQSEMYTLFEKLDQLDEMQLLPARDPGRFWLFRILWYGDSTQLIGPNREDFYRWRSKPENNVSSLSAVLESRHNRSLLLHYYLNHVNRAMKVTMLLGAVQAAVLHIPEIPSYFEAELSASQKATIGTPVNSASDRAIDLKIVKEMHRLETQIAREETKPNPDAELIGSLKGDLQDLISQSPWLVYTVVK